MLTSSPAASQLSRSSKIYSRDRDSSYLWYSAVVLVAIAYYLVYLNYGIDLDDEGFFIGGASEIIHSGHFPVADFMSYPPWMYFSLGEFLHLFGETLLVERALLIVHLLINIVCLLWLSPKMLPPLAGLIPVIFYAAAPGAWYRVFFVFSIIIVTVALVFFNDRPSLRRALLLGLVTGFAAIRAWKLRLFRSWYLRARLPYLRFVIFAPAKDRHHRVAIYRKRRGLSRWYGHCTHCCGHSVCRDRQASRADRECDSLCEPLHLREGCCRARSRRHVQALAALLTSDARTMGVCRRHGGLRRADYQRCATFKSEPQHFVSPRRKILLGAMAIASMGETFFFVWNSRMLSTFAIVTLAVIILLYDMIGRLGSLRRMAVFAGGCAIVTLVIVNFSKTVDYYSGSIYVFQPCIRYRPTIVPFLKGAMVWQPQADTIDQLNRIAQEHPDATLVPMTYCTTLGYLSGLRNPTYYRLFTGADPGKEGEEAAIKTFERYRITYFVARRGTFFAQDDPGAKQMAVLPLVKNYLLSHYDIRLLGENYVILVRSGGP